MAEDLPHYTVAPGTTSLGRCIGCGYPLAGLEQSDSDRCPECGRSFDPRDPSTTHRGLPLTGYARWALKPAGVLTFLPLVIAAGWAVWTARAPGTASGVVGFHSGAKPLWISVEMKPIHSRTL